MDKIDKLKDICNRDISDFRLYGKTYFGKVVYIYSSNLIKLVLLLDNIVLKFNSILLNVDNDNKLTNKLKNLCTDINSDIDITNLSKEEKTKILDKNKKIITVECYNFDKNGMLEVKLYSMACKKQCYNSIISSNNNHKNDSNNSLLFNMSPPL